MRQEFYLTERGTAMLVYLPQDSETFSWADEEFGEAKLGDSRRTRRLIQIAKDLAAHPATSLPQATEDWAAPPLLIAFLIIRMWPLLQFFRVIVKRPFRERVISYECYLFKIRPF